MKLKIDTFYRTRDGRKVYIYKEDESDFLGCFLGDYVVGCWAKDGYYVDDCDKPETDIVSEWEEKPFHLRVGKRYKTRDGRIAFVQGVNSGYFTGVTVGASTFGNTWSADGRADKCGESEYDLMECIDDD